MNLIALESPDGETFYVAPRHIAAIVPGDAGCYLYISARQHVLKCADTAQTVADKLRFSDQPPPLAAGMTRGRPG